MRYPNLFLIGAPKSGTTYLHAVLKNSANVFSSPRKEPAFFLVDGQRITYKSRDSDPLPSSFDRAEYQKLYENSGPSKYAIDASTHYLSSPETAAKIKAASPDAKIVAVLREPISRAYSHYLMGVRDGFITENLHKALMIEREEMAISGKLFSEHYRMVRRSLYFDGVKAFYQAFGGAGFRVYMFEDVVKRPNDVLDDLAVFLDLERSQLSEVVDDDVKNPYAVDRFGPLTRLIQRYRESKARNMVNSMTPRGARDIARRLYDRARLRQDSKPPLSAQDKETLAFALGDDYPRALQFSRQAGILFEADANKP